MEKALLDGEKETEMEELQRDQERINILKERHREVVERAARERQKVRMGSTKGSNYGFYMYMYYNHFITMIFVQTFNSRTTQCLTYVHVFSNYILHYNLSCILNYF